jgi:hypothetical protein
MPSEQSVRRGVLSVLGYAVVILVTTPVVTRMLATAWDDRGPSYALVVAIINAVGVDIDLSVIVPAGFVLVLLFLFALDEYKRIQAVLLVVGCVGFLITLSRMGKWTRTVNWGRYWWGLIPGGLVGLLGLYGARLPTRGRREFPAAARWLYRVTALVVVIGLLEYHLQFRGGLGVQPRNFYLTLPASVFLLMAVAEFVRYTNREDVVIIGGNDDAEASLLGGLFAEARDRFGGVPLRSDGGREGAVFLNTAASAADVDSLPDRSAVESVKFKFTSGGFFSRQIVVTANRYAPPTERDLDALRERTVTGDSKLQSVGRFLRRRCAVLVPRLLRRVVRSGSNRMADRLRSADTILLVAPLSDFVDEYRTESGEYENWQSLLTDDLPHYASIYRDLCDLYARDDRRAIIVATEASLAMRAYEEKETRYPPFHDSAFTSFVANVVLTGNDADPSRQTCDLIAVDRRLGEDDEQSEGFDRLLLELS